MKKEHKQSLYIFCKRVTLPSIIGTVVLILSAALFRNISIVATIVLGVLAAVTVAMFIVTQVIYRIAESKGWFKEFECDDDSKAREKFTEQRRRKLADSRRKKQPDYYIEIIDRSLEQTLELLFPSHTVHAFDDGVMYYMPTKDRNGRVNDVEVFYVPRIVENSYNDISEQERLKSLNKILCDYFTREGISSAQMEIVVFHVYETVDAAKRQFYNLFSGYWDCEMSGNRLTVNRQLNYCAVDMSTSQLHFMVQTSADSGTEADLGWLILALCNDIKD